MYHTDVVLKYSAKLLSHGMPLNVATVPGTVPATTSTIMNSTMSSTGKLSVPVFNASNVFTVSGRIRSMIEKKMSRLMPFPIPRSVICSPSHITNTPPDRERHEPAHLLLDHRADPARD